MFFCSWPAGGHVLFKDNQCIDRLLVHIAYLYPVCRPGLTADAHFVNCADEMALGIITGRLTHVIAMSPDGDVCPLGIVTYVVIIFYKICLF